MYACIDLGSNSFHLLIAEWQDGKSQIVERFSHIVQLGEGVALTGEISPAAFARGIDCLQEFADVMARYPIRQYWALGTNALRLSRNAPQFLEQARLLGLDVSVISGVQEAILVYLGVMSGLPRSEDARLVVDIGGGSTEVIIGVQDTRLVTRSLPIGCVSWRDQYFAKPAHSPSQLVRTLDDAVDAAQAVFESIREECLQHPWAQAYASSGTAKMLAAICQMRGFPEGQITLKALLSLRADVLACAADPDALLPGLKDRRKDLLMPGWAVLVGLMRAYDIEQIQFSPTALREGMLHFMMQKGPDTAQLDRASLPQVTQTPL
jgi:exopolyphosphatase/guanosine-5'-triphosphate,3'-diphosphate pyrophosphatase